MIDIYCNDGKCPICEAENKFNKVQDGIHYYCRNGCYGFQTYKDSAYHCVLRDYCFEYHLGYHPNKVVVEDQVMSEIIYWKKNDRYILEKLEGRY